jgi:hypothetical protein
MDKRPGNAALKIPILDDRCKSVKSEYDVVSLDGEHSAPFSVKKWQEEKVTKNSW